MCIEVCSNCCMFLGNNIGQSVVKHKRVNLQKKCITRFKISHTAGTELAKNRIDPGSPFYHTDIDLLGPLKGRDKRARDDKPIKLYACLCI